MIDTLAVAALCGLSVERLAMAEPVEAVMWERITRRAGEIHLQFIRYQANQIAVEVSKLFRK